MQQRRVRLGDVLDDYCPRERRITNHVVVAMINDEVKQTRCTTCDADHDYKQARIPPQRRKKSDLPGDSGDGALRPRSVLDEEADGDAPDADADVDGADVTGSAETPQPSAAAATDADADPDGEPLSAQSDDDGPVHRRLIRATLPRPEGQAPERKEPDFTIRQPGRGRGDFERDGNRHGRRPMRAQGGPQQPRFGGPRHGPGGGQGQGQRPPGNRPGPPGGPRGNRPPGPGGGGRGGGRKRGGR